MEGERTLKLSVSSNKLGVEKADVVTVSVPDQNDFSVYDVTYVSGRALRGGRFHGVWMWAKI